MAMYLFYGIGGVCGADHQPDNQPQGKRRTPPLKPTSFPAAPPLGDVLVNVFPSNPVQAMAEGEMLQVIVFALLIEFRDYRRAKPGRTRVAAFFKDFEGVIMKIVAMMMLLAPYGVFALFAKLFARWASVPLSILASIS